MSTKVFHLQLDGPDSDFGPINYCPVKISIESTLTWEPEEIKEFKECFANYFDVNPLNIWTEEEGKRDTEQMEKYLKEQP